MRHRVTGLPGSRGSPASGSAGYCDGSAKAAETLQFRRR